MANKITHVRVQSPGSSEQHITHIKISTGTTYTRAEAVKNIDSGIEHYFTTGDGKTATVVTVHPNSGEPYIKTKPDSTIKDNLLSLPRF
jgi:hypothetical protein